MIQVTFPFSQFTDKAGLPLDAGFIYIGTENLNPETNQIALFWDDALTIPAAQPLRTINGYISRNGSPGRVYTDTSAYSITVRDKSSNLVATALDASALDNLRADLAAPSGSSLVGDMPAGAGAVAKTVQSALQETVSVSLAFPNGYVTDGSVDYTTQIVTAFSVAAVLGAKLVGVAGTYKVTGTGVLINAPVDFDMRGMIIKNLSGNVIRVSGGRINFSNGTLYSIGGGHTVLQTNEVNQSTWSKMQLIQSSGAYSIWDNAGFDYVDMRHRDFIYQHVIGATVPGFNLVNAGGKINDNIWESGRANYSGNYFFHIESTTANFQYHNKFSGITFEVCTGGGIRLIACDHYEITNCANWDAQSSGPILKDFYSIEKNASGYGSYGSIKGCSRLAGVNNAGIVDLKLPISGLGAGTIVENCFNVSAGDPFTCNFKSNSAIVIGTVSSRFVGSEDTAAVYLGGGALTLPGELHANGSLLIGAATAITGSPSNVFLMPAGGTVGTRNIESFFLSGDAAGTMTLALSATNIAGYLDIVVQGAFGATNREGFAAYKVLFARPSGAATVITVQAPTNVGGTFTTSFTFAATKPDANTINLVMGKASGATFTMYVSGQLSNLASITNSFV